MNVAVLCVLIGGLQAPMWGLVAKYGARRDGVAYDNRQPRNIMASYTGWYQRADWAQKNALEAFPFFAAAVALCLVTGVNGQLLTLWSVIWVVARFVYGLCYIANRDLWRSLVWGLATFASIRLFIAAI